jgi:transposase
MRKIREILRQKWALGRSHREVAASLSVSVGIVAKTVLRATTAKLTWEIVAALDEAALETRLYGRGAEPGAARSEPDCAWIDLERRKPGVTLELLHLEYLEKHPGGYRYTQFCELYRRWLKRKRLVMRHVHRAGEKVFTDYAGKRPNIVDMATGEAIAVELFVAVLGASNLTYAEATRTQRVTDWTASHVRALEYFGGVPGAVVPDQLKSGVTEACRYEPGIQRTYEELARHYGTTILPARPAMPRDKAKAEVGVQIAERWIVARLRNESHFGLETLNERIAELLEEINGRTMRRYGESRRELFERLERAALRPLPAERFVYGEWKIAKVGIDYHIEVDHHLYSVPFALAHERVDVRMTAPTVEIFHRGERVASHVRSHGRGRHSTIDAHMPERHRQHLEWTPGRMIQWASSIGPQTAQLVTAILESRRHPEQGYRSCLGILRLARHYGDARLEAASSRSLAAGARSYRHVDSVLRAGLDRLPIAETKAATASPPAHENIRGRDYYH